MTVNVIVSTCDFLSYTKLCTRSILENTHIPYKLFYVDDLSKDGTVEWLKTVPNATVIENKTEKRHGPWIGYNLVMKSYPADYYAFVDRDMILTPNWLSKLVSMLKQHHEVGIGVPVMNVGPGEQGVPQGGGVNPGNVVQRFLGAGHGAFLPTYITYDEIQRLGHIVAETYARQCVYNAPVWFHCAMVPQSTIEKIGMFDETFYWCDGDMDYVYRCVKKNLYPAVRRDTYCHHLDGIVGQPWQPRDGHYRGHGAGDWIRKYPHFDQWKPEGKDWNSFIPHKNTMGELPL